MGILTDGFNSTKKSLGQLFATAKIANCMLHATIKLPGQIKEVTKAVRQKLCGQFRCIFFVQRARKTLNPSAFGQQLRPFGLKVTTLAGEDNGGRVQKWIARKKEGWDVLFAEDFKELLKIFYQYTPDNHVGRSIPQCDGPEVVHAVSGSYCFVLPETRMKGFHHSDGSQRVYLNGLAIKEVVDEQLLLANLIPYQRRAINGKMLSMDNIFGKCAIEVEGGKVP